MDPVIADYIEGFEGKTRERLIEMFEIIRGVLPNAKQKIAYGVPTFYNDTGYIMYFAGYKDFVSMYPVHLVPDFVDELQPYLSGKSTARFSHAKPLPKDLIIRLAVALVQSNQERKKK